MITCDVFYDNHTQNWARDCLTIQKQFRFVHSLSRARCVSHEGKTQKFSMSDNWKRKYPFVTHLRTVLHEFWIISKTSQCDELSRSHYRVMDGGLVVPLLQDESSSRTTSSWTTSHYTTELQLHRSPRTMNFQLLNHRGRLCHLHSRENFGSRTNHAQMSTVSLERHQVTSSATKMACVRTQGGRARSRQSSQISSSPRRLTRFFLPSFLPTLRPATHNLLQN